MLVRDGMSRVVLTVGPDHTLRAAAALMAGRRVGAAAVLCGRHAGRAGRGEAGPGGGGGATCENTGHLARGPAGGGVGAAPPTAADAPDPLPRRTRPSAACRRSWAPTARIACISR